MLHRLAIKEANRANPISIVSSDDFSCEPAGQIGAEEVLSDPKFGLYCFDLGSRSALFVETSDPAAVDRAPFYYQAQAQFATELVAMPFEVFHQIAERISFPQRNLIFVHSVGRCGSTLASKVLQAIPSVHSLSEPDDLSQLVHIRTQKGAPDKLISELLSSSVKWRCKPRYGVPADYVAIKPRSEVMTLADLLGVSFSEAKHFFLYRNAVSWMRTIFRGFALDRDVYDKELNRKMEQSWAKTLPIVGDLRQEGTPMNPVQIRILGWVACMEGYLRLAEMPIPSCAARFEDLISDPLPILQQFLTFCEIESADWNAIRDVLDRDSQAGTVYDREERRKQNRELTAELVQDVYDLVATRRQLLVPDVLLPKTLCSDV